MDTSQNNKVGICNIAVAALRKLPDNHAPLLSQILFGEKVVVISEKNKHWWRVVCEWDEVVGWIDPKQFRFDDFKYKTMLHAQCKAFALEHLHGISGGSNTFPIMLGSNLYECDGLNVKMPSGKYQYTGQYVDIEQSRHSRKVLLNIARRFLHAPYFEGGRSITGTDASGFIQIVFKMIGIDIPRYPIEIAGLGDDIGFYNEAAPGDIAFFGKGNKSISHMGIIIEDGLILHAYGRVKADKLDQQGIYDLDENRYTFRLRSIRRHFPLNS